MSETEIDILREEIELLKAKLNKLLEVKSLEKRVNATDARLDKLEKRFSRSVETGFGIEKEIVRLIEIIKDENADALDRIKNIELKFFPNLASDLDHLHSVIGRTGPKDECPQERRKP